MNKKLHPTEKFSPEDVDRILKEVKTLAAFLANEHSRQWSDQQNLIADTEFNSNPVRTHRDNFHWRGNDQSRKSFFQAAVFRHEIFYVSDEKTFLTHFDKMIPDDMFVLGKKKMSEMVYLFRRLSAPEVNLLTPMLWRKILPLHYTDEFGVALKENCVATRASLELELCVRSEKRRKILDSIIGEVLRENQNR